MNNNSGFNQWNANRNANAKKSKFSGFLWWFFVFITAWWLLGFIVEPKNTNQPAVEEVAVVDLSAVPQHSIDSEKLHATVQGLRISNVKLDDFAAGADNEEHVTLLSGDDNFIEIGMLASGTSAPVATTVWGDKDGAYTWRNNDGVTYSRAITVDGYVLTVTDTIKNNSKTNISVSPYVRIIRENDTKSSSGVTSGAIAYVNSDIEQAPWHKMDKKSYAYSTTTGFAGFADQYWETVASIDKPDQTIRIKKTGDKYSSDIAAGAVPVASGDSATIATNIFIGPREQSVLDTAEGKIAGIAETIDYGWFWFLARPMLWMLNMIHHLVMNYGVAIIIMTILLRLMMWPLTRKSYVNMAIMQKMQPEMQRIQKLYANDKMRLQMEMMKLYQTHKTSPMAGCLPMLIQIPIFFALYKALLISVPMRNAHFLWISDLSAMDPYFILPIMMGATMWLQQRLQTSNINSSKSNDAAAQTKKMMSWLPILFTIMFAWMPAGLVLYWTVSNLFGILQMQIIKNQNK